MTWSSVRKFSFKVRQKTYTKAKKVTFCRCASLYDHKFKLIHAKAKAWVFANNFSSQFIGCGFTNHSKYLLQLQSNIVLYHFCFLKSRKLLYIRDMYSKSLGSAPIIFFAAVFTRKVWGFWTNKSRQFYVPWFRLTLMDLAFRVLFSLIPNNIWLDKVWAICNNWN